MKKITKIEAEYEPEAMDDEICSECEYFIHSDESDDPAGTCSKVEGEVDAGAWCKLFEAISPIEEEEEEE